MRHFGKRMYDALCLADSLAKVLNVYRAYVWMRDHFDT